ncbi:MAG: ABC transporter permease [Edaphobacter sp.]|uniref:ABC transporter permease n=1 Tax=Edaphobacter sp. TaxID=1934404 RepID=UPI00239E9F22|nr:ABC transporter permease [Edaphobacter sp.]MDE1176016.1 ABC transporter permease [Edaphobacter sp.]
MTWWSKQRSTAEELAEEMECHLLEKAEALEAEGMSPEEALRAARRSFGNRALLQDRAEEVWTNRFSQLATNFRFAMLQLKRQPIFLVAAILILSLGIGANTAIFAGLNQAVFRKLPVRDPDGLVFVSLSSPQFQEHPIPLPYPFLSDLQSWPSDLEDLSAWHHDLVMVPDENNQQRSLNAMLVTGNALGMLGVEAAAGRLLKPEDTKPHLEVWPVVLSYSFWTEKYHRSAEAIGQRLVVSGQPVQIVGVTPQGFEGITPNVATQMYLPITFLSAQGALGGDKPLDDRDLFVTTTVARLRYGVTMQEANAHLQAVSAIPLQRMLQPFLTRRPFLNGMGLQLSSASHGVAVLGDYGRTLTLLQILMAGVLAFCCINVAGLQLARRLERAHEFAVRVALGANRGHLIQQCLMEAVIIAIGGTLLAIPMTFAVTHLFSDFLTKPGAGEIVTVHPDWRLLASAGIFALVGAAIVGAVPAIFAKNADPGAVLNAKSSMRRSPAIASRMLLAAQIAVTFFLLATASFYWRDLHRISEQNLGYNPKHITEICAQFQEIQRSPEEIMGLYRQMLHRLNAQGEIESATVTWITQLTTVDPKINVSLPDSRTIKDVSFNQIGPRYFATLQTKLLAGREFTEQDQDEDRCIVNELAAKKIFNTNPEQTIARRVRVSFFSEINTTCEVVGVVQSAKYADIHETPSPILFLPITTRSIRHGGWTNNMVFLVRGEHEEDIEKAYLDALSQVAPETGYQRFLPMERQLNDALGKERLLSYSTVFFGGVSLLLCSAATLSLLLMRVRQSIPEIAIRVALGATPLHAAGIVFREMAQLVTAGLVMGGVSLGVVAYLSTHYLQFQRPVAMSDIVGAICLLVVMTFSAGGIPALHAATLQPMQILCRDS